MITSKKISGFIVGIVIIALLFTGILLYLPQTNMATKVPYETSLFTKTEVMSVNIQMDGDKWKEFLENAASEKYSACDVTVNGTTYYNVGIRTKGNTSLTQIVNDDTTDRYSFKIKFDKYVENQTCEGLSKLVLNNIFKDNTYMKEYMSYDLMANLGIVTPLYAFSNISVNGSAWGTYIALESLEEDFSYRNFGEDYGALYKVEGTQMGGGGKAVGETKKSDGTDLIYTDDSISSYAGILDNESYDVTKSQKKALIKAVKKLNEGTDIESYVDVDQTLKYFAANVFLVNLDSYLSNMTHNYYLYEKDGKITPIPWDYNLSFAGFQSGDSTSAINYPIDTVLSGVDLSERPLIGKLLEKEEYREKYHQYLNEIVTNYVMNGTFENTIDYMAGILDESIKNDPTAFTSYTDYQKAVSQLKEFGTLRALSVQGQINGTVPSTTKEQTEQSNKLIDASSIDLTVLGVMGGGMGGGRMGDQGEHFEGRPDRNDQDKEGTPPKMEHTTDGVDRADLKGSMKNGGGMERPDQINRVSTDYLILCACAITILFITIIVLRKYRSR